MEYPFSSQRGGPGRPNEVPWDRILVLIPVAILVIVALVLATDSFYTVEAHEKAVVMRFGKYTKTVLPGLWFKIPMVDQVLKVSVAEQQLRLPGYAGMEELAMSNVPEEETLMLTGDLNAASVESAMRMIEGTARSMGLTVVD